MSVNHNLSSQTLMIQGTTSDAGKSTLVAGLCRVWADRKCQVVPFKPQNMALNSAVTADGGEIGRAQAVQAQAARVELSVHLNPILLKPSSDQNAQVIIHGKAINSMQAQQYHDYKKVAMEAVLYSHQQLTDKYQRVCVEGAGSPAEINLREGDIANMGFAEAVDCPVIIIADIDKGGVFAHLVGTLALLSQSEQDRVVGFVINRFRGDLALLEPGLTWLEQQTNKPVLGVLPYLHQLNLAQEDALNIEQENQKSKLNIAVLVTPRMSNHTDFDILRLHPEINCQFIYGQVNECKSLPKVDLIIFPGSKNVREDLAFIKQQGWHQDINRHLRYGGKLFGICGGYQMLGSKIIDHQGIESQPGESEGLTYLPMVTELKDDKVLTNVSGTLELAGDKVNFKGYEIHAGRTRLLKDSDQKCDTLITIDNKASGLISDDQQVAGCYIHGLFDQTGVINLFAKWLNTDLTETINLSDQQEQAIDRVAKACEQHLDLDKIDNILRDWY